MREGGSSKRTLLSVCLSIGLLHKWFKGFKEFKKFEKYNWLYAQHESVP